MLQASPKSEKGKDPAPSISVVLSRVSTIPGMSMSFSVDLDHIISTHMYLVQCSLRDDVDGMLLVSESALCHTDLRIISSHFSCFISGSVSTIEWYKVTGEL